MEQLLICMSLSLIAGLLASRAAKAIRLPAVTSYLVAGLLLGPFFLGRLGLSGWGFGFGSLAQVESYGIITQVALGFIAFVIGNEFRLSALESMGRQAVTVGICRPLSPPCWWISLWLPCTLPGRMSSQWHRPSRWVPSPLPQPLPPP